MIVEQWVWTASAGWTPTRGAGAAGATGPPALVLAFSSSARLARAETWAELRARWPSARIVASSTAGEIAGTRVLDDSIVATVLAFESTRVVCEAAPIADAADSEAVGRALGERLAAPGVAHVLVLSDGLRVNGSELVRGLAAALPAGVAVTGGLAGDGSRFARTVVGLDEPAAGGQIVGVAFVSDRLRVGFGSLGGWDAFGPIRRVTRAAGNVLHELDGRPALELYRRYLGEHASGLPSTGLLFPLAVWRRERADAVVRTILGVDESASSLTFAGDVPEGAQVQLMRANFDRLVDGAAGAARSSHEALGGEPAEVALLISCVGRRLVLKQRVEEEVEGVRDVLGDRPVLAGFYSYGEISPVTPSARCELHNQTMTITTFAER